MRFSSRFAAAAAATLLALGGAAAWRMPLNHDVAWFLYLARQILDGARLYADFPEINPPLIVWLHLGPAWLASWLGVAPGALLRGALLAMAAGSCWWSWRLLLRGGWPAASGTVWLLAAAYVAAVLPGYDYGQREHIALLACLPYLAGVLLRSQGAGGRAGELAAAALLAAIGLALKPHFALVPLLLEGWLGWRRRGWPGPSLWLMAACALAYALAIHVLTPDYAVMLRVFAPSYSQHAAAAHWSNVWQGSTSSAALFLLLAAVALQPGAPAVRALALAGLGFALAALAQQKGWSYHWYPAYALGWLAFAQAAAGVLAARAWRGAALAPPMVALVLLVLALAGLAGARRTGLEQNPYPAMLGPVLRELGGGPVLFMATPVRAAFPLLTEAGVSPATRMPTMALVPTAWQAGDDAVLRFVRHCLAQDMRRAPPRLLVVQRAGLPPGFDFLALYRADPQLAAMLQPYRLVRQLGGFDVLRR